MGRCSPFSLQPAFAVQERAAELVCARGLRNCAAPPASVLLFCCRARCGAPVIATRFYRCCCAGHAAASGCQAATNTPLATSSPPRSSAHPGGQRHLAAQHHPLPAARHVCPLSPLPGAAKGTSRLLWRQRWGGVEWGGFGWVWWRDHLAGFLSFLKALAACTRLSWPAASERTGKRGRCDRHGVTTRALPVVSPVAGSPHPCPTCLLTGHARPPRRPSCGAVLCLPLPRAAPPPAHRGHRRLHPGWELLNGLWPAACCPLLGALPACSPAQPCRQPGLVGRTGD